MFKSVPNCEFSRAMEDHNVWYFYEVQAKTKEDGNGHKIQMEDEDEVQEIFHDALTSLSLIHI